MCRLFLIVQCVLVLTLYSVRSQSTERRVGRLREVFAWRQLTYNINGNLVLEDRASGNDLEDGASRNKRQADNVFFDNNLNESERNWKQKTARSTSFNSRPSWQQARPSSPTTYRVPISSSTNTTPNGPTQTGTNRVPSSSTTTRRPSDSDDSNRFFIQYNNLPMGVERVGERLFITVPRRRYGIPSTLNYIDLSESNQRSPPLRPYPSLRESRALTSVYRTRADECGRLWMVDTGLLEIPNNMQQVQPAAIVAYDLNTNTQILRYQLKSSDLPASNSPTGLASITIDIINGDCNNTYAYVPELTTYGIIVYSLRDNDSWRLTHNFFHFSPTAGNLNIAGQRFQWSDGIFSITLTDPNRDGCRTAYFHPMVSTQEFSVSTCVLRNSTISSDSNYWSYYALVGERGGDSQSTMHGFHSGSKVVFFAEIARNAVSCWNTAQMLSPANVVMLAEDSQTLVYPSDLHITGDEVWVMANNLPRFGYSRLDTNEYNFFIYRGNIQEMISGTACSGQNYASYGG